jgi:hypothetical protein
LSRSSGQVEKEVEVIIRGKARAKENT